MFSKRCIGKCAGYLNQTHLLQRSQFHYYAENSTIFHKRNTWLKASHIPVTINSVISVRTLRRRSQTERLSLQTAYDNLLTEEEICSKRHPRNIIDNENPSKETETFKIQGSDDPFNTNKERKRKRTGMDIANKMRQEKKNRSQLLASKLEDPLKRSVLALQPPNLNYLKPEKLAHLIRKHIIYADERLVIFNKPYGIPSHGGDEVQNNIKQVLPMLSKMVYGVNTEIPLTLCHRLDKNTTGVVICAADKDMAKHVMNVLRMQLCIRKYWAVVVGTPDPLEGTIQIPTCHTMHTDSKTSRQYARMTSKPEIKYDAMTGEETRAHGPGTKAITNYRVMDFGGGLALLELQPLTTSKHQLRVHTSDGLDCPILGDHKYAAVNSLAPQILPENILNRFKIVSTKTRHMPMHLHHRGILIPDVFPEKKKKHLVVLSKLPTHMHRTMLKFNLNPGKPSDWKLKGPSYHCFGVMEPKKANDSIYQDPTAVGKTTQNSKDNYSDENQCVYVYNSQVKVKFRKK